MKKIVVSIIIFSGLFLGAAFAQTGFKEKIAQKIENKISAAENTKSEWLNANVMFQVLDMKQKIDFDILGREKGFNRRLSRVTAQLVNIEVSADHPKVHPLAFKFLQKNASEIDLEVKYRSTVAGGYFSSGDWNSASGKAFIEAFKKNKNTRFKGTVGVLMSVGPDGNASIDEVRLLSVNLDK